MQAVLAPPYLAACKLTKGQVKRLPLMSLKLLMFVVACPSCSWKAQVMASEFQIAENPFQLTPAVRCGGCGILYSICDGEFVIEGDGHGR